MPVARDAQCPTPPVGDLNTFEARKEFEHGLSDLAMDRLVLIKISGDLRTKVIGRSPPTEDYSVIRGCLGIDAHIAHVIERSPLVYSVVTQLLGIQWFRSNNQRMQRS